MALKLHVHNFLVGYMLVGVCESYLTRQFSLITVIHVGPVTTSLLDINVNYFQAQNYLHFLINNGNIKSDMSTVFLL